MGIRGLTTFINNRSHLYLQNYELHDCSLVIDGNSIACQLYKWHSHCNDCFGGDYDKFARTVENFFHVLLGCGITPYVVLDGGYEQRKLATVISRMKNKIKSAQQLSPVTEDSISVFPLCIRETFVDVMQRLNIHVARCELEGDTELASLAKCLNCPVLSYDSDFFIFDVPYIPFSNVDVVPKKKVIIVENTKQTINYITCKIYKIENFLNSFGGLDKSKLPLLAVIMGNDYVHRSVFALFFNNLKRQKCHGQSEQQKRIKSVIVWLQNETVASAIKTIIRRYKLQNRQKILDKIQNAIKGYYYINSPLFEYFNLTPHHEVNDSKEINFEKILQEPENMDVLEEDNSESSENDDLLDFDGADNQDVKKNLLSTEFLKNFKKCIYPPCFMDMILRNKYYCVPQIEDNSQEYCSKISSDIFTALHQILTENSSNSLSVYARNEQNTVQKYVFNYSDNDVIFLKDLKTADLTQCKLAFSKILQINSEFESDLSNFPNSMKLFIISLYYFISKTSFDIPIVNALIISFLVLHYVDKEAGVCRSLKAFEKKFSQAIQNINNVGIQSPSNGLFQGMNLRDSLCCLQKLIPFFQIDFKMRSNIRLFDRSLVHTLSQFQNVFLHITYLNSLLKFPFENISVAEVFNGTFAYNLSTNFAKRTNLNSYIELIFKDSPSIYSAFQCIFQTVNKHFKDNVPSCLPLKKKRKRKHKKDKDQATIDDPDQVAHEVVTEDPVFDPNNKFSLLTLA